MSTKHRPTENLLLHVLPPEVVTTHFQRRSYALKEVLCSAEDLPRFAFFPHGGAVASIVRATTSGQMVEAGVVSAEGVANVQTLLTNPAPAGNLVIVQNEGEFSRIERGKAVELLNNLTNFRDGVMSYTSLFLDQIMQNLVCNRLHTIEQRMAKWLLMMRDRTMNDELALTQEFLSYMLGVHRPGVSIAVSVFEEEGLIEHRRSRITLRDKKGIEARACECYRPLRDKLALFVKNHSAVRNATDLKLLPEQSLSRIGCAVALQPIEEQHEHRNGHAETLRRAADDR